MLKRMFKKDFLFTALYVCSFSMSILVLYFGMSWGYTYRCTIENNNSRMYAYSVQMICDLTGMDYDSYCENVYDGLKNLPEVKTGNVYYRSVACMENSLTEGGPVNVILRQNEPVKGNMVRYLDEGIETEYPKAILGNFYQNKVKEKGGMYYISLNGQKFVVEAILKPDGFEELDNFIWIYADEVTSDNLKQMGNDSYRTEAMVYWVSDSDMGEDSTEKIYRALADRFGADKVAKSRYVMPSNINYSSSYINIFLVFMTFLFIFTLLNCGAISYIWGKIHLNEWIVRKIWGESNGAIYLHILAQILVYCLLAVVLAGGCITIWIMCSDSQSFSDGIDIVGSGFGWLFLGMILFVLISSIVPLRWIRKASIASELKRYENGWG